MKRFVFLELLLVIAAAQNSCDLETNDKFDCFPDRNGTNQEACEARGCCWVPVQAHGGVPYCFYPQGYSTYTFENVAETSFGYSIDLTRGPGNAIYPNPIDRLQMNVYLVSDATLRIKIVDPANQRWESPYPNVAAAFSQKNAKNPLYTFQVDKTGFKITRNSDKTVIINTSGQVLIYNDQYIQITTRLPTTYIYGLGEHQTSFVLPMDYTTFSMFSHDVSPSATNLYGSHPFYLAMENSGNSHGVFLLNSNALEAALQPTPSITYRTVGGILDFFYFFGPTPKQVLQQYVEVIGEPQEVPFWAFGFHLCRYGIETLEATKTVLKRNLDAGIPIEVQWNDLDYMDLRRDFSYSNETFAGLPEFVQDLHAQNRRWIPLVDPGIDADSSNYAPFDRGQALDIFIKDYKGDLLRGKVWSAGDTAFPDFTHPSIVDYWYEMLNGFYQQVPFDGVWIDMNEPSNFVDGSADGCPENSSLEHPPYIPHIGTDQLYSKTVCMTAKQSAGLHYNLHNLYGITEGKATNAVLRRINSKERPVIISRSTFPGSGAYNGHWSGDISSSWNDMKLSVTQLLNFGLYGIPFMGADICGFTGDTNEDLCSKWMQLGAFYPFSRNHNNDNSREQDPAALGDLVVASSVKALSVRYSLLTYIYTSYMYVDGYEPLARPLFYEFPLENETYGIDEQFLLGPALLVVPNFTPDNAEISAYFPKGGWFDFYTLAKITGSQAMMVSSEPDTIRLFIRAGRILTMQTPEKTTTATRANKLQILVALNDLGRANGSLYWDDGVSLDTRANKKYTLVQITASNNTLQFNTILDAGGEIPPIELVSVLDIDKPSEVRINNQAVNFNYLEDGANVRVMYIENLNLKITDNLTISWTFSSN